MYTIIAFTHKASSDQLETATSCLKFLEIEEGRLFNIPTHRVEDHIKPHTIIVTFGQQASEQVNQYMVEKKFSNCKHFTLPYPNQLIKTEENSDYRKAALSTLTEIKELIEANIFIPENIKVTNKDIPDLNAQQILLLTKITEENNRNSCFQVNRHGKLIEISKEPTDNSKADIQITFEELYTIKSIMDVLQVSEVEIVTTSQKNST